MRVDGWTGQTTHLRLARGKTGLLFLIDQAGYHIGSIDRIGVCVDRSFLEMHVVRISREFAPCGIMGTMKEDPRPYQERIIADPQILSGKPVVRGTRIAVDLVLEELAQNPDIDELLAAHPDLTRTDVQACLAYAKAMVTGEEVSPKPPKGARSDARPV